MILMLLNIGCVLLIGENFTGTDASLLPVMLNISLV